MKVYHIELQRTAYITVVVSADNKEEAEEKAWQEIEHGRFDPQDTQWAIVEIEEVGGTT